MIFRQLFDSVSCTYTYLLADPKTGKAVLIDPVFEHHDRDAALVRELDLDLVYTLDTHVHADHVTGAWLMKQAFGSKIALSGRYDIDVVDQAVDHGHTLRFGELGLEVRATPGHTSGCVTYVTSDHSQAFTGDALLIRGAGRTDFQGGDAAMLYQSITEQLFTLPSQCLLYPAHDYAGRTVTSVMEEQRFNARAGGEANQEDFVGFMNNLGLAHPRKLDIAVPANMRLGRPEDPQAFDGHSQASWAPVTLTYANIPQIEADWVAENLSKLHIIDVRSPQEFAGPLAPIEGAALVPLDELRQRLDSIPKDKPVVAVCRSGMRSGQAAVILRKGGFTKLANLKGGMLEWHRLRLPTASAESP